VPRIEPEGGKLTTTDWLLSFRDLSNATRDCPCAKTVPGFGDSGGQTERVRR
jgi:hypothetical protein